MLIALSLLCYSVRSPFVSVDEKGEGTQCSAQANIAGSLSPDLHT